MNKPQQVPVQVESQEVKKEVAPFFGFGDDIWIWVVVLFFLFIGFGDGGSFFGLGTQKKGLL